MTEPVQLAGVHPEIAHLSWLVGQWRGVGEGAYPDMEPFRYEEVCEFATDGRPFLEYRSVSWILDDDNQRVRPARTESGYWRGTPGNGVEAILTQPTGYAEVWLGTVTVSNITNARITHAKMEIRADAIAHTPTWLATPVLTATSTNTQTSLSINSLNKKNNTYFWVRNYGTFALQSFTIAQVVAPTGQSPTVEIHYCSGTWDVMKDLCSGTLTVLLSTGDGLSGSALVPIAIPVGGSIELAAHPTKNGMATTISASVSRANIRAARTSHA